MAVTRGRRIAGLTLLVLAGTAAALLIWWSRRRPPPPGGEAAFRPPPAVALALAAKPFAPWVRFERMREGRDLFERLYIDLLLGHQVFKLPPRGLSPQRARALMLDDDDVLLPSGRKLWNRELLPQPGLAGKFCYVHSDYCLKRLFEVHFVIDNRPVVIYDNFYTIERFPSRTVMRYRLSGVWIDEHKYITDDDRAVSTFDIRSVDGRNHVVSIEVSASNVPVPHAVGATAYPLLAQGRYRGHELYVYLDAPGFAVVDGYPFHLRRVLTVGGKKAQRTNVAVSFETAARGSAGGVLPADLLERHVVKYEQWFADNVPYFDAPDGLVKKMWYYRWWLVRFHRVAPETAEIQGYAFYEGMLGFDNLISFAVPAQLEELAYLRDPAYGVDQVRNAYRNRSESGALADAGGSPYWGEMYSQWTAGALADFTRVHRVEPAVLRDLLPAMAGDVRAWMSKFDADGDGLPGRRIPRITGYDLDILSWWYFNGLKLDHFRPPPALERVDFASFVYANARGVAEIAAAVGAERTAEEFTGLAAKIRAAVLEKLWDPKTSFFYPQRGDNDERIPVRELHGFFPFTMRLAPDAPEYHEALRKFVDPDEFWARYPPVITSLQHYKQWKWGMDGLTRNIAPHPLSMGGLTLIRALHDYHQKVVTPAHFMEFLKRYTALMYPGVLPGNPSWRPNAHEYYSEWEPGSRSQLPKPSDISHDFHSMYCALVVQGAIGLKPRRDGKIELRPAAREWPYFVLDRLRYQGHDLTILWDQPDGSVRYSGYPEGFSLYIDGKLAFTRPTLAPVVYDPATAEVRAAG